MQLEYTKKYTLIFREVISIMILIIALTLLLASSSVAYAEICSHGRYTYSYSYVSRTPCETDYVSTKTCVDCGQSETRVLSTTYSHSMGEWVLLSTNKTSDGHTVQVWTSTCSKCGYKTSKTTFY